MIQKESVIVCRNLFPKGVRIRKRILFITIKQIQFLMGYVNTYMYKLIEANIKYTYRKYATIGDESFCIK